MGRAIIFIATLFIALPAIAHDTPPIFNRINLSVSAQQEVDNDILVAVLYAQEEGNNAAHLAKRVNRAVTSAVNQAKQSQGIKVQTLDYTTNPIYRNQTLSGWRVRQSVRLESKEPAVLSELIGDLQKGLSVSSIQYALSPAARASVEEQLIAVAIEKFNSRAQLIRQQMGHNSHQLVQMNINSSGHTPRPQVAMSRMAMAEAAPAPTIEAGTQTVMVNISGSIELQ